MYKTIFFDIGGVLLNIYPERTIDYLANITNLTSEQITDSFPEEEHHKYERGEISDNDFYSAVKNNLSNSSDLSSNYFWKAWSMMVGERSQVANLMDKLAENFSVWLLSNTNPYHIIKEKRTEIFKKIDGAIYSYDVGFRKPESGIYEIALEKSDTKPKEALFIDDLKTNVLAAKEVGIDAIHFVSFDDLVKNLKNRQIL